MGALLFRISLKGEEIKMENKEKMKTHKCYTYQKLTIIFVITEIMKTLTIFVSDLPKTPRQQFSMKIYDAIS